MAEKVHTWQSDEDRQFVKSAFCFSVLGLGLIKTDNAYDNRLKLFQNVYIVTSLLFNGGGRVEE